MSGSTNYGTGSLQNNTGQDNSAFGNYAASSNTDASCNTAVGSNALANNTTGPHNTSIGAGSMFYNKTGDRNTAVGSSALEGPLAPLTTVGNQNVAIGAQALFSNYGSNNVAVGCFSLINNTDGSGNTAVGVSAGYDLSGNSFRNTFVGAYADVSSNLLVYNYSTALGYNATIDASNQIVLGGKNAGGSYPSVNIPGSYVGIGGVYNPGNGFTLDVSGNLRTTADAEINTLTVGRGGGNVSTNTATGYQALKNNTSGFNNTAIGYQALQNNISGVDNVATGYRALQNNLGNTNTALGYQALLNNISGYDNIAIGYNAGIDLSGNSFRNTFVGTQTDVSSNLLAYNNSTALGYNATIDAANQIVLGGKNNFGSYPSVNIPGSYVGIGGVYNTTNGFTLDVLGKLKTSADAEINTLTVGTGGGNVSTNTAIGNGALLANATGANNVAIGYTCMYNNSSGNKNIAVGRDALNKITFSNSNVAIGNEAGIDLSGNSNFNTFLGDTANVVSSSVIYNNSTALGYLATIDGSNQINLGNSSITNLKCQVVLTVVSDARDKTNFVPLDAGLNFINEIHPVRFDWNQRGGGLEGRKDVGFTAQDLLEVQEKTNISIPHLVDVSNPDKYGISNTQLLPILVKAVQELSAKVTSLETELSELKK